MELLLAVVATFGAVLIIAATVVSMTLERRRVSRTLRALPVSDLRPDDLRGRTLAIPMVERLLRPLGQRLYRTVRRLTPVGELERFEEKLRRAGNPAGLDAARLAAFRFLGRIVLPIITYLLLVSGDMEQGRALVLAVVVGLLSHIAPDALLDNLIGKRQEEIRIALPDTIDLITITVEAGLGFDAATDRVGRSTEGELGEELRRVVRDMQLGRPREDALRAFADRVNLPELRNLVSALIQAEQFGITIGDVLRSQADELRERRRHRAEEHAQKMPVKILLPLIFMIMPAIFVVMLGPGIIQLLDQFG